MVITVSDLEQRQKATPRSAQSFIYLFIYLFKSDKGQLTATNISQS
jgi:hypothetical protein